MSAEISPLAVALEHARQGRPVFPVNPSSKRPFVADWPNAATVDEAALRHLWSRWPRAMAGMPTGEASGLFVVDMDRDDSAGVDGVSEFARLDASADTLTVATPRGGRHAYYRFDCARPVATSAGKIAPGVDIRGKGGYIVLAGSRRIDGASYTVEQDLEPAEAPEALYALLAPSAEAPRPTSDKLISAARSAAAPVSSVASYIDAACEGELMAVRNAPAGQRNDTLNRAAFALGQFVGAGALSEEMIAADLSAVADACGLPQREARATIASGLRAGKAEPRDLSAIGVPDPLNRVILGKAVVATSEVTRANDVADQGARGGLFRVTRFDEIGEEHHKEWLVADFLGAGEMTAIYGLPGSGKSVIVTDIAAHVAAGEPWFGRKVKQGAVLYIAAERGSVVKRRLAAWRKHHGQWGLPLLVVEGSFDFRGGPAHAEEIIRLAREEENAFGQPVVWIVIDTKAQVLGGGDPNSDQDVIAIVKSAADMQRAIGAHVTFIDHVPHTEPTRLKGSGALAGAIDGSFLVQQSGSGSHQIHLGSKRPNDGPDEFALRFTLESVEIGVKPDGSATTAPVVVPDEAAAHSSEIALGGRPFKLRLSAQRIKAAFGRLFDQERTTPAPDAPGVRPGTRAVTLADLRAEAETLGLTSDPEPPQHDTEGRKKWQGARRQAWKSGFEQLVEKGALRAEAGFVWDPTHGRSVSGSVISRVSERDLP
jgi:hypothetical protein